MELNIGLLEELNKAETKEDKQAALMSLVSLISHEYLEDFGGDRGDVGNGAFGAYPMQEQIFAGESPGFYDLDVENWDYNSTASKHAIERLKEGGTHENPTVIPTVPNIEKK